MKNAGWNRTNKSKYQGTSYSAGNVFEKTTVGELRPSQMLYTFGVGAIVDLPKIAAMVMGLDDWDLAYCVPIEEDRLLAAVRLTVGDQVQSLRMPPLKPETGPPGSVSENSHIGVPVAAFPRWMVCPVLLALAYLNFGPICSARNGRVTFMRTVQGRESPPKCCQFGFCLPARTATSTIFLGGGSAMKARRSAKVRFVLQMLGFRVKRLTSS